MTAWEQVGDVVLGVAVAATFYVWACLMALAF